MQNKPNSKLEKFGEASLEAATRVAGLPIPTWAKFLIAAVSGAAAVFAYQDPTIANIVTNLL